MKTIYNEKQGLFSQSAGSNSIDFSHFTLDFSTKARAHFTVAGRVADTNELTLKDVEGNEVTLIIVGADDVVDGRVNAAGKVVVGINANGDAEADIDDIVTVINLISEFDQTVNGGADELAKTLTLNITAVKTAADSFALEMDTAGSLGNKAITSTLANTTLKDQTPGGFTGGIDKETELAKAGFFILQEEVEVDQTNAAGGELVANDVAVKLSNKIPPNSVVVTSSLTSTQLGTSEGSQYDLLMSTVDTALLAAHDGSAIAVSGALANGSADALGDVVAKEHVDLKGATFPQVTCVADNSADTGTVKMLATIIYAGLGMPTSI
jgi:hypothetical protein